MFNIVARIDGKRCIESTHATYEQALARWRDLDAALRLGRLAEVIEPCASGYPHTHVRIIPKESPTGSIYARTTLNYLAVRDADDPQWQRASRIELVVLPANRGGHRDADDAIRKIAKRFKYHGHDGGWIYWGVDPNHTDCTRTVQGWFNWWRWTAMPNMRVQLFHIDGTRRWVS